MNINTILKGKRFLTVKREKEKKTSAQGNLTVRMPYLWCCSKECGVPTNPHYATSAATGSMWGWYNVYPIA